MTIDLNIFSWYYIITVTDVAVHQFILIIFVYNMSRKITLNIGLGPPPFLSHLRVVSPSQQPPKSTRLSEMVYVKKNFEILKLK